jgi:two-component system LytT family response regulator
VSDHLRVAIVDDEPLARQKLRFMLESAPDVQLVGEAGDGEAAVRMLAAAKPALVCLDIKLPGLSGLDVLRVAKWQPEVIFTTAFDQFAVSAFELAAVDYLLKPFSRSRFETALSRARARISAAGSPGAADRLRDVTATRYLSRVFVRDGGVVRSVRLTTVDYFEASDDYVIVHTGGVRFELRASLSECMSRLDPAVFLRIHRRYGVNMDRVEAIAPIEGARFQVRMRGGDVLEASRTHSRALRARGV